MFRNSNKGAHNGFGEGNAAHTSSGRIATGGANFDHCANKLDHLLFLNRVFIVAVQRPLSRREHFSRR